MILLTKLFVRVSSTGSTDSEGEMDQIDPPLQPNEEGWFDLYHDHLRRPASYVSVADAKIILF